MEHEKDYQYVGSKEELLEGLKGKSIVDLEHKYGGTLFILNTGEVVVVGSTGMVLFPSTEVMEEQRADFEKFQAARRENKVEGKLLDGTSLPQEVVETLMARMGIDVGRLKNAESAEEVEAILDAAGATDVQGTETRPEVTTGNGEEDEKISWPKLDANGT